MNYRLRKSIYWVIVSSFVIHKTNKKSYYAMPENQCIQDLMVIWLDTSKNWNKKKKSGNGLSQFLYILLKITKYRFIL